MDVAVKLLERAKGATVMRQQAIKMKDVQYSNDGKRFQKKKELRLWI